ncbi:MAG: glycosyltransferase [Chloroflexota bacterium]|nr:glycosyltransferase [Chloroflexota bacterium]
MRIVIVTDQYPPMVGGVPTVTHGLAVDFANRGHQVWVVAPSQGSRDVRRLEQKVRVYRFSSFEWPTYKDLRIPFLPFVPIRNLLKKADPDIIHIHSPVVLGNIAQILAGGLRKPVIATNHYLPINISRSLTSDPLFGKHFSNISYGYLIHFCNRCEYVTTPTTTAMDLLYEHGLRAPAGVISNGIDLKKFSPGPPNEEVRHRFNLPKDRPLVLHVNRLSEEKRVDVLLEAATRLKGNAYIALVGTGPAEMELREQAERLQLGDRVAFLGYVRDADLLAIRHMSDVFVIPSEADLQSLATMEAMACGLPIIAANAYALPELVHHGENGFVFQPGNSEELAYQIDTILAEGEMRARMGSKSLEIIAPHDRIQVLDQWETLYRRLSTEFIEAKLRKQRRRMERKYPDYKKRSALRPRMVRTSSLFKEQRTFLEEP